MTKEKISVISDEHQSWLSALVFYKDELNVLRGRLTEIASKNTSKELLAQVEHFENSITLQQENIDILKFNEDKRYSLIFSISTLEHTDDFESVV